MKIKRIFLIIIVLVLCFLEYYLILNFDEYTVKTGIIDKNKKNIVDFKYDFIDPTDLNYNPNYIDVQRDGKSFYIDLSTVTEHSESVPGFYKNRGSAYSNQLKKSGYIDSNFNKTSEFIYDNVESRYNDNGYALVEINNKKGLIDLDGNTILPCAYDNIEVLSDYFFLVSNENELFIINKNEEKIAIFNEDCTKFKFTLLNDLKNYGEIELEYFFPDKITFRDIASKAKEYFLNRYIAIMDEKRIETFDMSGNKVYEITGEMIDIDRVGYDAYINIIRNQNGVEQIIFDELGNEIFRDDIMNSLVSTKSMSRNTVIDNNRMIELKVTEKDVKFGIMDFSKNTIIEAKYDTIYFPDNYGGLKDIYTVKQGEKYGVIDIDGNMIIEPSFKYKDLIWGNKEYFIVESYNTLLFAIFFTLILLIFIIILFLIFKIFKKKKIVSSNTNTFE